MPTVSTTSYTSYSVHTTAWTLHNIHILPTPFQIRREEGRMEVEEDLPKRNILKLIKDTFIFYTTLFFSLTAIFR